MDDKITPKKIEVSFYFDTPETRAFNESLLSAPIVAVVFGGESYLVDANIDNEQINQ